MCDNRGICADCDYNDETCSMCDSCKDCSNFNPKKRPDKESKPMPVMDQKSRYYDAGGIETINVIKAKLSPEQYKGWLLGNLIKYSCRANFKGQFIRDIEKINFYSGKLFGEI